MITNARPMARQAQGCDVQTSIVVGFCRALQRLFATLGADVPKLQKVGILSEGRLLLVFIWTW